MRRILFSCAVVAMLPVGLSAQVRVDTTRADTTWADTVREGKPTAEPLAAPPQDPCPRPAVVTSFHSRETLRRELERFRLEAEGARRALPPRGNVAYDAGMARYRVAIAAYREAAAHTRRRCRWMPNQVLALIPSPVERGANGDVIMLDVLYYYTGDHGAETSIGAITKLNGRSTGHWAYRPVRLAQGLRRARIELAMDPASPGTYRSDAVEVEMYTHRMGPFTERSFPLEHTWRRER